MNLTAILRKCRGVAAIGLLWTPLWTAIVLSIIFTVSLFLPLGGDVDVARIVAVLLWVGLVGGTLFGLLLSVFEETEDVRGLSLWRVALLGALAAAAFPLLTGRANQAVWTCPIGALTSVALVWGAKQLDRRTHAAGPLAKLLRAIGPLSAVRDAVTPPEAEPLVVRRAPRN